MTPQAIQDLATEIAKNHSNIAALTVLQNGKAVYNYSGHGCNAATPVHVFSVTKSVVSLLVGIAIGKGYIQSVHQPVLHFFPNYTPKRGEKTLQTLTLRHLLTMTAPYKYKWAPYTKYFTSDDWVKSALDLLGGRGEVGRFRYTPLIGPDILSGVLVQATGRPLAQLAATELFAPLGIPPKPNITFQGKNDQLAFLKTHGVNGWVADPQGVNTAGWGLTLSATDMAHIGQLCLQNGTWQGKQIVPAAWVEESTRPHSHWQEQNLPFGYLWWPGAGGESTFAAMGDSGNLIYCNPAKNLVVSIAALYKPTAKLRLPLVAKFIEPYSS